MKFTGKQLFNAGIPQSQIKFLIEIEFNSIEEVHDYVNSLKPKAKEVVENTDLIIDWLWETELSEGHLLPHDLKGDLPVLMSKGGLRRLMDTGGLLFNQRKPNSKDTFREDDFPIRQLVWFPNGVRRVTLINQPEYFNQQEETSWRQMCEREKEKKDQQKKDSVNKRELAELKRLKEKYESK